MKLKVVIFIVTQLLLVGVFYLTLNYSDFELIGSNGEDKNIEIEIRSSDRDSDELVLSGPDAVDAGRKVTWKIGGDATDVIWFEIEKKPGHRDVFKGAPPTGNRHRHAVGQLKNQSTRIEYEYSINWLDRAGEEHLYDPKIAIRPGTRIFEILIYTLSYFLLVAMISFMAFKK